MFVSEGMRYFDLAKEDLESDLNVSSALEIDKSYSLVDLDELEKLDDFSLESSKSIFAILNEIKFSVLSSVDSFLRFTLKSLNDYFLSYSRILDIDLSVWKQFYLARFKDVIDLDSLDMFLDDDYMSFDFTNVLRPKIDIKYSEDFISCMRDLRYIAALFEKLILAFSKLEESMGNSKVKWAAEREKQSVLKRVEETRRDFIWKKDFERSVSISNRLSSKIKRLERRKRVFKKSLKGLSAKADLSLLISLLKKNNVSNDELNLIRSKSFDLSDLSHFEFNLKLLSEQLTVLKDTESDLEISEKEDMINSFNKRRLMTALVFFALLSFAAYKSFINDGTSSLEETKKSEEPQEKLVEEEKFSSIDVPMRRGNKVMYPAILDQTDDKMLKLDKNFIDLFVSDLPLMLRGVSFEGLDVVFEYRKDGSNLLDFYGITEGDYVPCDTGNIDACHMVLGDSTNFLNTSRYLAEFLKFLHYKNLNILDKDGERSFYNELLILFFSQEYFKNEYELDDVFVFVRDFYKYYPELKSISLGVDFKYKDFLKGNLYSLKKYLLIESFRDFFRSKGLSFEPVYVDLLMYCQSNDLHNISEEEFLKVIDSLAPGFIDFVNTLPVLRPLKADKFVGGILRKSGRFDLLAFKSEMIDGEYKLENLPNTFYLSLEYIDENGNIKGENLYDLWPEDTRDHMKALFVDGDSVVAEELDDNILKPYLIKKTFRYFELKDSLNTYVAGDFSKIKSIRLIDVAGKSYDVKLDF